MISDKSFEISKYRFDGSLNKSLETQKFIHELWPIVYILSHGSKKVAYVGETTDASSRLNSHLRSDEKSTLREAHIIKSDLFNKSATLDIESNLIKYLSGDGQYQLLNGNVGLANHNYYQKDEVYWDMFMAIWDNLRSLGISKHSIEHIDNSDLFKYSPYKSLSKEQLTGLMSIINSLVDGSYSNIVIQGGAGTGKTILAIFLFKLLMTNLSDFSFRDFKDQGIIDKIEKIKGLHPNLEMALVVPMSSFRKTLKKVFSKVKGLKSNMVIGPSEVTRKKYDIIVVDEAHRLRRRVNLGTYFGAFDKANMKLRLDQDHTELDWMKIQSKCCVYFYDKDQSIKPSDVQRADFNSLIDSKDTKVERLHSQFRVKGGNGYVNFVNGLLSGSLSPGSIYSDRKYELQLTESISDLVKMIKSKNEEVGLSRLIAGYSWEWVSKKNPELYDIEIQDVQLKWNNTTTDWINSENAVEEVGCIHTTQGYDLNYAGIIFGNEIGYDPKNKKIVIHEDQYFDRNGKLSIKEPQELKDYILNIYKTILLRGIRGTFIYVCDPELRAYMSNHLVLKEPVVDIEIRPELIPYENAVPLFDLKAAAGSFSELQSVDSHEWVQVPADIKASESLFACKVIGESMNRIIPNGATCLFRKYEGGSRNGKIVLVQSREIQDPEIGSGYTVKEYNSKKVANDFGWQHESIVLKPLSNDPNFQDIVLDSEGIESFQVVGVFERVLV